MNKIAAGYDFPLEALRALGLPEHCIGFNLNVTAKEPVTVQVDHYVTDLVFGKFTDMISSGEYRLVRTDQAPRYAIWDIDNCLADDRHRLHLIDWHLQGDERYTRYNAAMMDDPIVHSWIFHLFHRLGAIPIFCTGRPEHFRDLTNRWLARDLDLPAPMMKMRPSGTVGITPVELKRRMLLEIFNSGIHPSQIVAAFDDLPNVIDMYRKLGVPAMQLAIADHTAAYEPADLEAA